MGVVAGAFQIHEIANTRQIAPDVGSEPGEKLQSPLIFQQSAAGSTQPPVTGCGYDVTILIDICKSIIRSHEDGKLQKRHAAIAKQAHIIVSASAKAGIRGLVYALAGYKRGVMKPTQAFRLKFVSMALSIPEQDRLAVYRPLDESASRRKSGVYG